MNGTGPWLGRGRLVCHCLLIEAPGGLVLVDTGLGAAEIADPRGRLGREGVFFLGPKCDPAEAAAAQVRRLGFAPDDVRDVVVTHLDADHAGGLAEFPWARVHLHRPERDAALGPATAMERGRYNPRQWAHGPRWCAYDPAGEPWLGFQCVRDLAGLPPEILLIPLAGHTRGHSGVAVRTAEGWLLHAGDAYLYRGEIDPERPRCTPGLAFNHRTGSHDRASRERNRDRLRALAREHPEVRIFSGHDPVEFARLTGA